MSLSGKLGSEAKDLSLPINIEISKSSKSSLPCCPIVEVGVFTYIYGKALSRLLNFHVKRLYSTFVSGMNLSHICSRILALSMFSENVLMANIFLLFNTVTIIDDCFKYILLHLCVCGYTCMCTIMHIHAYTCCYIHVGVRGQLGRVVSVLT